MVLGKRICVGWNRLLLLLPVVILIPHFLSGRSFHLSFRIFMLYLCLTNGIKMFLPVTELHQLMDSRDVTKEKPKKLDHLIQGPAAGEGLPSRLQCQGWTNSYTV